MKGNDRSWLSCSTAIFTFIEQKNFWISNQRTCNSYQLSKLKESIISTLRHWPMRCFCPPDSVAPRSPTGVSYFWRKTSNCIVQSPCLSSLHPVVPWWSRGHWPFLLPPSHLRRWPSLGRRGYSDEWSLGITLALGWPHQCVLATISDCNRILDGHRSSLNQTPDHRSVGAVGHTWIFLSRMNRRGQSFGHTERRRRCRWESLHQDVMDKWSERP